MNHIDTIKLKFNNLKKDGQRTAFIEFVADEFNKSPATVRQHWLCDFGFWRIPMKYQERVVELFEEFNTVEL